MSFLSLGSVQFVYLSNFLYRIIEIAGGREIYSQSRSKAIRKSRNTTDEDKKKQKSPMRQGIWELRGRCTEPKKHKNALELTETVFSSEVCSVTHQQPEQTKKITENENKTTVETDDMMFTGEVVVFDDIDDSWRNEKMENSHSNDTPPSVNLTASNLLNESECERVTKVIGNLPIAVYEGSPRRYGMRHHVENNCSHPQLPSAQSLLASPSVYPPRPGFPQRIVCTPSENEPNACVETNNFQKKSPPPTNTSTFDYLYEFSETRKVLEEFFKCPPPEEENRLEVEFQDLEYELKRQTSDSGNSYVGQRLAKGRQEQNDFCIRVESPRKHSNSSNLLGLPSVSK